ELSSDSPVSYFEFTRILRDCAREKNIFIHGKVRVQERAEITLGNHYHVLFAELCSIPQEKDQDAVVILEKTPVRQDTLSEILMSSQLKLEMKNDVYSTYQLQAPAHLNEIKTTVVCPATEKHVKKDLHQEVFLVEESGLSIVPVPCVSFSYEVHNCTAHLSFWIQWVHNILEKKAEVDRIVFENPDPDTGFVLLPDFKWDQKQLQDLYLIAIVHRRDVKSLRDLTSEHLPLLTNIHSKGEDAIQRQYGVPPRKLCMYLHYQPSYYHLQFHFTSLEYDAPGVESAHLLSDVIQNLQADSSYYHNRSLVFPLRADDGFQGSKREAEKPKTP
uniref:m7GpppX diphosphatase n=1 Tax=Cyprinus carpio TaxID=7962 RepID=A0A8C1WUR7_CYPCA